MQDYQINVSEVEELQMIDNRAELERIFEKAKSAVVNGASVMLCRPTPGGKDSVFDEITTEADLSTYRAGVFKYMSP
jgi:hypothetical protein